MCPASWSQTRPEATLILRRHHPAARRLLQANEARGDGEQASMSNQCHRILARPGTGLPQGFPSLRGLLVVRDRAVKAKALCAGTTTQKARELDDSRIIHRSHCGSVQEKHSFKVECKIHFHCGSSRGGTVPTRMLSCRDTRPCRSTRLS